MSRVFVVLAGVALVACHATAHNYILNAAPLALFGAGHPGLCVAVDPADPQGIWWWEPGPSGCSRRTTGPTLFRADGAKVESQRNAGSVDARFMLQMHSGPPLDVHLTVRGDAMRVMSSGQQVAIERRTILDIPPAYGQ